MVVADLDTKLAGECFSRHCGPLVELVGVEVAQVPHEAFASADLVEFLFVIPSVGLKHVVGVRPNGCPVEQVGEDAGMAAADWAEHTAGVSHGRG